MARVLVAMWEHFRSGEPMTTESIAQAAGISTVLCQVALEALCDKRLAEPKENDEQTEYLLRRHIGELTLAEVEVMLEDPQMKKSERELISSPAWELVSSNLENAEAARREKLQMTLEKAAGL